MFIARQPIFDKEMNIYGYELLFRSDFNATSFNESNPIIATANVLGGLFETGIKQIVNGTKAFVNFDYDFILSDEIELINSDTLVIEVLENVQVDSKLVDKLKDLKILGYKIALDDFVENYDEYQLVPISDIIKYDIIETPLDTLGSAIKKAMAQNKILLAEKIETEEEFLIAKKMGFQLFQGYFFSKPSIISKVNDKKSTKVSYSRLISELKKDEPSYQVLADIIKTDVNLAFRLMRVMSTKKSEELVYSIKKALLYMGFKEIERWINILMLQELLGDKPVELLRLSLVRTKFGEFLASNSILVERKSEVSMMCLFSSLDAVLDIPMQEALSEITLTDDVKKALISGSGDLEPICELICNYEMGDWEAVRVVANKIEIDEEIVIKGYLEALNYANDILSKF